MTTSSAARFELELHVHGDDDDDDADDDVAAWAPMREPARGQRVGRYVIEGLIGHGSWGVVMRARDPTKARTVALRLLHPRGLRVATADARAALRRDLEVALALRHPNLVSAHELGAWEKTVYIAMDHVDGPSLDDWLRADEHDWRVIVAKLVGAAAGLSAAHERGALHLGFTLRSALLERDGRARVKDIGMVPRAPDPGLGVLWSAPSCMPPEQFTSGAPVDARSDQFGFCAALWYALCGQRPYGDDDALSICRRALDGALLEPRAPRAPAAVLDVLRRGLAPDAARRWPDMRALIERIEAAARARGCVARGRG
ncbi:MAG: serine/threonine protein kinase [Myxococcales bacterium]|nr:serine/threonine protein kinase [Myxococcales bacterium]